MLLKQMVLEDILKVKSEPTIVDIQTDYLQKYIRKKLPPNDKKMARMMRTIIEILTSHAQHYNHFLQNF